ncbi:hypothetical protein CTEN210_13927 [Chaetoceros tenuissimus]|uniref:HSF-type DNA-binding domain-containing protein n=1 Tax=Chaetoceros tenuissimus TaxID=426638 RepID=A0AAD3HBR7_9STRA|nr:hypothetical protein CTEN210_13927 [Chaetoceros tenuissimus]
MPTFRVVDQSEDKDAVSALMQLACTSKNVETKSTNTPPLNTEVPKQQPPTTKNSPPEESITYNFHQPHPVSTTKELSNQNKHNDGDGDRDNFPVELLRVLNNFQNSTAITWSKDGRSFYVKDHKVFVNQIIPTNFTSIRPEYEAFLSKLQEWGFVKFYDKTESSLPSFRHESFHSETEESKVQALCDTISAAEHNASIELENRLEAMRQHLNYARELQAVRVIELSRNPQDLSEFYQMTISDYASNTSEKTLMLLKYVKMQRMKHRRVMKLVCTHFRAAQIHATNRNSSLDSFSTQNDAFIQQRKMQQKIPLNFSTMRHGLSSVNSNGHQILIRRMGSP